MTETLKDLIKKRGSIKARLTIFSNFIKDVENHTEIKDVEVIELERRLIKSNEIITDFDAIQNVIECLDENPEAQYSEREGFEKSYFQITSLAQRILNNLKSDNQEQSITPARSLSSHGHAQVNAIKLPIIQLPKFSGEYETWLEFRDTFESLIHTNNDIGEIQKFHYLRASLEGSAAQLIKSLEFSSANYTVAWELLCNRFNNMRLLIHNHVKALFNLESSQKESSGYIRKLIDSITKNLRALSTLNEPTSHWDTLIIYIVSSKLDNITAREWEEYRTKNDINVPTLENLMLFLKNRADLLETIEINKSEKRLNKNTEHQYQSKVRGLASTSVSTNQTSLACPICKKEHRVHNCDQFLKLSSKERYEKARVFRLCLNCLKSGHSHKYCRLGPCTKCKVKHNTLLHFEQANTITENNPDVDNVTLTSCNIQGQVLLSTAVVQIRDKGNIVHAVRVLLDAGSQSCFMTENLCRRLNLEKTKVEVMVAGINNAVTKITNKCNIKIHSQHNDFGVNISCFIIPEITNNLPNVKIKPDILNIPKNIRLADPTFYQPAVVDILIGADVFWELICIGQIRLGPNQPVLQKTRFGWIVSGPTNGVEQKGVQCKFAKNLEVQDQLARFWELEEIPTRKVWSEEERACETHFQQNTKRLDNGQFLVTIPLKDTATKLGNSFEQAKNRFYSIERKLQNNSVLREEYIKFMNDYEMLGHMSETSLLKNTEVESNISYYMPHHGILRESSSTTKLRVVFDASAPSSTGVSFNNLQMIGPTVQDDLLAILLRFRQHRFVVTADVEKMYRQILVNSEQRALQQILWRSNSTEPLKSYTLNTVTYGTASAPFLAIRCIQQLAQECSNESPSISEIIHRDFYVDDLLTGADTLQETLEISNKISDILKSGGFNLRKWRSNDVRVLGGVGDYDLPSNTTNDNFHFSETKDTKTLGLMWSCSNDILKFNIHIDVKPATKRSILSGVAQIFDPLGLLGPTIILAKIMLQQLWLEKLSWDDLIPRQLQLSWFKFTEELPYLNQINIKRHISRANSKVIELHGCADSSERVFGGCIFIKVTDKHGEVSVNLLCSKSKVAPLKQTTIPRLELCGALVLARLASKVMISLRLNFNRVVLWSDSTIVLGWLKTAPNLLKPFIANRVAEIQELSKNVQWRHMPTKENPADLLSRGVSARLIGETKVWWHGPQFLLQSEMYWPVLYERAENLPELKRQVNALIVQEIELFPFGRFSNLSRIKRCLAFIIRFKNNCQRPRCDRQIGPLTVNELDDSYELLIKMSQIESFPEEYNSLLKSKDLKPKSKLLNLSPFLDSKNRLRVGGRLHNAEFTYNKKHPFLLSSKHHLTKLIFSYEHLRLLHAGPQLLLYSIRDTIWPMAGRNLARATVHKCIKCYRFKANSANPIMGNLPVQRLQGGYPFRVCGVDYAGPFMIKNKRGRGCKLSKCYMSLFICFTTKAIHLEAVSDLSKDTFISALKRFVARRGKPLEIFSDNGTNFVGACAEIKRITQFFKENKHSIIEASAMEGIKWNFIPAYAPHFGGLWEAGVKSTKHHLERVMREAHLTFEEITTVLVQIEAVLNSRPLTPLSTNPLDLDPLTPAHFLIGRPLTALPEPNIENIPTTRLSRYQRLEQIRQHFWVRWQREFVSELQSKTRWRTNHNLLKEGSMVLIKDDHLPPLKWSIGRVIQLFPGRDGVSRVAAIRTSSGTVKRAFSKICPLPVEDKELKGDTFKAGGMLGTSTSLPQSNEYASVTS